MICSSMQTREVATRAPTSVVSAPGHRPCTVTIAQVYELDLHNTKNLTTLIYGIWPQASKQTYTRTCAMQSR